MSTVVMGLYAIRGVLSVFNFSIYSRDQGWANTNENSRTEFQVFW